VIDTIWPKLQPEVSMTLSNQKGLNSKKYREFGRRNITSDTVCIGRGKLPSSNSPIFVKKDITLFLFMPPQLEGLRSIYEHTVQPRMMIYTGIQIIAIRVSRSGSDTGNPWQKTTGGGF
jgi:hypothetical protein